MNTNEYIEGTIESLLSSIADGVREAQDSLNDLPPIDIYGRAVPSYHIPYVDFDLAVSLSMRQTTENIPNIKRLRFNPMGQSQTAEISSHISGRIVSIPPGEGLPLIDLMAEENLDNQSAKIRTIRVLARNSNGELMRDRKVEFNINWELTTALNSNLPANRNNAARLENSALITNEDGTTTTTLHFGNSTKVGTVILLDINMGSSITRLSITR